MATRRVAGIKIDIQANTARLSQDMTKSVGILQVFERRAQAISRSLKVALAGAILGGAAYGIKQFSDTVLKLAEIGDKAGDIAGAFEKLGGSSKALEEASNRTQGLIDKFDLMKAANEALIRGLPDVNKNFADFADLATRVASARDLDPLETLNELIAGLSSGKAEALKKFGFSLQDVKGKTEVTATALSQLQTVLDQFSPVTLGVADSVTVFKNSLSEAVKNIGIGVDSSAMLASQLQELRVQADPERMQQFGQSLAVVEGVFIGMAVKTLPTAIEYLEKFALGLDNIFAVTKRGEFFKALGDQEAITKALQDERARSESGFNFSISGGKVKRLRVEDLDRQIQESLAEEKQIIDKFNASEKKANEDLLLQREKAAEDYAKRTAEIFKKYGYDPENGSYQPPEPIRGGQPSGGKPGKAQAEITMRDLAQEADQFRLAIEDAISRIDPAAFEQYRLSLYKSTEEAFIQANQTLVTEGLKTQEELGAMARAEAQKTVQQYDQQMQDATRQHAELMRQSHEEAVQQWSGVLDQLFNPGQYSWQDSLKQLAQGFASEILAGLVGGINGDLSTFQGVGQVIGRAILGTLGSAGGQGSGAGWGNSYPDLSGATKGANQNLFDQFGNWISRQFSSEQSTSASGEMFDPGSSNISTDAAHEAGIQGPGGADGQFNSGAGAESYSGFFQAGLQVFGDALAARDRDRANQDNSGTGAAVGGGIGGIFGGIIGGPQGAAIGASIGSAIGGFVGSLFKWGAQNPETKARKAFSDYVEEGFKKLETIGFFDAAGEMRLFNSQNLDFVTGSSTRFNAGGDTGGTNWADNFNKLGSEAVTVFKGLGEAFEEVLGLTEDVGAQIAYILSENLGGNIDNARLLVQQLGLDMEDMIDALIAAGRTGEMTWLEVESAIQGVNSAFGEGLVAVGNVSGAWEEFVGSGGRGMAALKGLKDIAIEAMEAGAKSLEDLRARLIAAGANPEAVDAMINAIRGRGITTLQQLADANDRTLGGIVADTNAASESLTRDWQEMGNKVKEFKKTLDELDEKMTKDLTINIKTNFDENTQKAMDEGVYSDTPAEKLQSSPMETPSSKSARYRRTVSNESGAKSSSMVVNIDARGAQRGVHNDVTTALAVMENRIVSRTANILAEQMQRGAI
jgi:hypothetical protein